MSDAELEEHRQRIADQQTVIDNLHRELAGLDADNKLLGEECAKLSEAKLDRDELVIVSTIIRNGFGEIPGDSSHNATLNAVTVAKDLIQQCNLESTKQQESS